MVRGGSAATHSFGPTLIEQASPHLLWPWCLAAHSQHGRGEAARLQPAPHVKAPPSHASPAHAPPAHAPSAHAPPAHAPPAHAPPAKSPYAEALQPTRGQAARHQPVLEVKYIHCRAARAHIPAHLLSHLHAHTCAHTRTPGQASFCGSFLRPCHPG